MGRGRRHRRPQSAAHCSAESLADFVDLVVPALQERGLFKADYAEGTLREKLFGEGRTVFPPRIGAPAIVPARERPLPPRNSPDRTHPPTGMEPAMSAATRLFAPDPHVGPGNALHRFAVTPASYEELAERFRPIFTRIAEGAVAREQSRALAFEAVGWLREAGFGALRIPQGYGGLGASLPQTFRLLIELGEADSNLPQIFRAHFAFVEERLNGKDEADRQRWFSLINDGALFGAAMAEKTEGTETTVTLAKEGDHWILDGYKFYSTGTIYATWIVAVALEGTEYVSLVLPTTAPGVVDRGRLGRLRPAPDGQRHDPLQPGRNRSRIRSFGRISVEQPPKSSYIIAYYQLFHLAALAGIARAV